VIPYGTRVHVAVRRVANCYIPFTSPYPTFTIMYDISSAGVSKYQANGTCRLAMCDFLLAFYIMTSGLGGTVVKFLI